MKRSQDIGTLRWIFCGVRGCMGWILIPCIVQSLLSVSSIGYALLLRGAIDAAVAGSYAGFAEKLMAFAALLIVQVALRALLRGAQERALSAVENRFRGQMFSCLMTRSYGQVTAVHTGEWLNRMQSDVRIVAEGLCAAAPQLLGAIVRLGCAAVTILMLYRMLGIVLIPCGLIAALCAWFFRKRMKTLHRQVQSKEDAVRVFLQDALGALMVIRAYAQEKNTEQKAQELLKEHRSARLRRNRFSNVCNSGFGAAMQGAYFLGVLFCGAGLINGTVSYGTCMALMQLVGQVQSPLVNITGQIPKLIAMLGSAERLMEAEKLQSDAGCTGTVEDTAAKHYYGHEFRAIVMEKISFSYEQGDGIRGVHNDLSVRVEKGDCVAVTGPSGCGKSTLLKLLLCLYDPDGGARLLEGKSGVRELKAADRGLFAYVPQGDHLMAGSIRSVLTFGDDLRMHDDNVLRQALETACALEFVCALPDGLDTVLGEGGLGLSEGQLQRIAVARAIVSERPILLLDECTSALDEETEARLLNNLHRLTDKTILIVTHRPQALKICNKHIRLAK